MIKKITIISLFLLAFAGALRPNAAQPGIRTAGGAAGFTLLFPEDSTAYGKVQMRHEQVCIQLYPGFAVIKGTYRMFNDTGEEITMKTGYPINAFFSSTKNASDLAEIFFDKLYQLKVSVDGINMPFQQMDFQGNNPRIQSMDYDENAQWYIWTTTFKPGETVIEVFFIVNTNDSTVSKGYSKESFNGFIYVLETGASWKPPIGEGHIRVQLMEGLTQKDIKGVAPASIFHEVEDGAYLAWDFTDLSPDHEDNLVITYGHRVDGFDFDQVISRSGDLFNNIESFSKIERADAVGAPVQFDSPFDISEAGNWFVGMIFFLAIYGIPVLIGIVLIFLVYRIIKRVRSNRKG